MPDTVRILIIDDEDIVILGIKKILNFDKEFNYIIDSSHTAEDGLEKMQSNFYDVILSDIVMPGMDGMELLDKVIKMNITSQIIMITGYATMKTALVALKKGAFDFLAKPFTKDELFDSLHRALKSGPLKIGDGKDTFMEKQLIQSSNIYLIPNKSWAKVVEDFSVTIGIENEFMKNIKKIKFIEILNRNDQIVQGYSFVKITTVIDNVYTLPSPFSGKVKAINDRIINNIDLIYNLPEYENWLIQIEPSEIENEVSNLVLKNKND